MLSVSDTGAQAPCPEPFNLAAHVLAKASALADKPALVIMQEHGADIWSYRTLEAQVRATGTGLLNAGLKAGDTVLLRLGNTVEFPIAYLGAIAAGLVPVPTSSQLTAPEVEKMIASLRPAAVITGQGVPCPESSPETAGILRLNEADLMAMLSLPPCSYDMGDPERLAYIVYTSGTSGTPRAVMHAHRAIWARQMMLTDWYDLQENDRMCHAGAFNWTFTLGTGLMDPWTVGATALIAAEGIGPEGLPELMRQHEASVFAAAPGIYRKILKSDVKIDLPQLRHGLSAGEKLSTPIREGWKRATGCEIYEAFGMSECSTFLSGCPAQPSEQGCLGAPQRGRKIALLDEDGTPVLRGQTGQIAVHRSDNGLMLGYLGAADETAARMAGEWFLTGDLGIMRASGQIEYAGRADDMMNAGGYRVSPLEVEQVLQGFEGITALAVTDVEVKADVRVIACFYTSDAPIDEAALARYAEARLAAYKRPKLYHRLEALPLGPNGKLRRAALGLELSATKALKPRHD